ncbi:MAG: 3-oxoadipate enol-lactonase [Thermodesulfobacteriota bacterium]
MFAEVNGIRTYFEISGRKEGPVVMLSHSLGSSHLMWNLQREALEPYFQLLRYDIRGHGMSGGGSEPYSLEQLGEDSIGLLDHLGIEQVHWVGISMGGMIGQAIALNHPHRLKSLVLCDTAAIIPQEAQPIWQERIDQVHKKGMDSQLEATMERWFSPSFLKTNPPILSLIQKQFLSTSIEGYVNCIEAIRRLNYLDRLSEIRIPTLILVGEDDPGTPVAASEAIHQRISGSILRIIPSARHLSNVEQPEIFNQHLLSFLKEHL